MGANFTTNYVHADHLGLCASRSIPAYRRRVLSGRSRNSCSYGVHPAARMDNGTELISAMLAKWARRHRIDVLFIQPGKPMQNGSIERFNRTYREEVLNSDIFKTLGEVRRMTADWLTRYNEQRRYDATSHRSNI